MTAGIGVDRAIEAVGVDAIKPQRGPAVTRSAMHEDQLCCAVNLTPFVTSLEPLSTAVEAYKAFDERQTGWVKVELIPELALVSNP